MKFLRMESAPVFTTVAGAMTALGTGFARTSGGAIGARNGRAGNLPARIVGDATALDSRNLLMIAFDGGRWGSARLVKPLSEAGFRVAALCPSDNPLAQTRFLDERFALTQLRSSRRFEARLAEVMRAWRPGLIVPCDERAVACLHAVVRRARSGFNVGLTREAMQVIMASMGDPERFNQTLMKSDTLRLARELGLTIPDSACVASKADAIVEASRIGYPVYVKSSFSWSGNGVRLCRDADEVAEAIDAAWPRRPTPLRDWLRRVVHRDWYPNRAPIDVQQAINGRPAMTCAVAVDGRVLASFAGVALQTCAANGPSSIAWVGPHVGMERASAEMIAALGFTGFVGFDFIIDSQTGEHYLLECNPRPIPICHLGKRIGVDLCAALAAELSGGRQEPATVVGEETIVLFPNEWQRHPEGLANTKYYIDIPFGDPPLMSSMVQAAAALMNQD